MFTKMMLLPALLLTCVLPPSNAYVIGANLTIENQTDVPMKILVIPPHQQSPILESIPVHQTTTIYMENGDHTGWLYQASVAPFSITDAAGNTEYVNGRVAYYVGGAFWSKYSFLDSVAAGKGTALDLTYSCENGGSGIVFENKIIVSGKPGEPARVSPNRDVVRCDGVKSSVLDQDQFFLKCSDDRQSKFAKLYPQAECRPGNYTWSPPTDGCYWWTGNRRMTYAIDPYVLHSHGLKVALDDALGGHVCQTFEKSLNSL